MVRDERGFAAVIAALLVVAIVTSLAFLVDISGLLIARQRAETMADFGAAAGGRVVVEEALALAEKEAAGKDIPPEDADHPERYLTTSTIQFLQTNPVFTRYVDTTTKEYLAANQPTGWKDFSLESDATIVYPEKVVDCTDPAERFVNVKTTIVYQYPFIFGFFLSFFCKKSR